MIADLKTVEKFRAAFREKDYRFLVARIVLYSLKNISANRTELYKEVNEILKDLSLKPISYSFIRKNE